MVLQRAAFPQAGELVVCRVVNIEKNYVEVELEDYRGLPNEERAHGMVNISELSNRWVKNINNVVSINQRLVLMVLRVDPSRGYIDLSLRRVNKEQRTSKMSEWKYEMRLEGLLKFFAEKHKINLDSLYENVIWPIIDKYGDIRTAFEEIKEEGIEALKAVDDLVLDDALIEDLYKLIQDNVVVPKVNIIVEYVIKSYRGDGIEVIKKAFEEIEKIEKPKGLSVNIHYIGAPTYRVEIEAKDYPTAEKHLKAITETFERIIGNEGIVKLNRDHLSSGSTGK